MRQFKFVFGLALILGIAINSNAQPVSGLISVLVVRQGLESALESFNTVLTKAGSEVRSTGSSLQANAQNVLPISIRCWAIGLTTLLTS